MFTKGEWKADKGCRIIIEESYGFEPTPENPEFVVAQCGIYNTVKSYQEQKANANLISAAPDMVEILEKVKLAFDNNYSDFWHTIVIGTNPADQISYGMIIDKALAKARGEL